MEIKFDKINDDRDFDEESKVLKALGHPIRLKIAAGLMCNQDCNVNQMVAKLDLPQSTVSQHLGVLRNAGIIMPRKNGVITCYEVTDVRVKKLLEVFCSNEA